MVLLNYGEIKNDRRMRKKSRRRKEVEEEEEEEGEGVRVGGGGGVGEGGVCTPCIYIQVKFQERVPSPVTLCQHRLM